MTWLQWIRERLLLHHRLYCLRFISFPSVHTSLIMFYLISFSPQSISFISQFISFIVTLSGCIHITGFFKLNVSFPFQAIPSVEICDLRVSLNKFLILDSYSLLEAELRWFYYSLSLYIKYEIQHGVRRNALVCSVVDVLLLIYSTQAYVGKR